MNDGRKLKFGINMMPPLQQLPYGMKALLEFKKYYVQDLTLVCVNAELVYCRKREFA